MYSVNYDRIYKKENEYLVTELGSPHLLSLNYISALEQPDWSFYMHSHDSMLEISYVLSGKGALYCAGKFYEILQGDIVIKNPGIKHTESSNSENPLEQVCILLDGLKLDGLAANEFPLNGLPPVIHAVKHQALLYALTQDILNEIIDITSPNFEYADRLLEMMLYACHDEVKSAVSEREYIEKIEQLEQIREYIDSNFMNNISLKELSEKFHISIYHLARQFKKYTGFTVNNYLVSCRIGEAQRRLLFQSESVTEIAEKSGFHSLAYFYSCFHGKVGCTPAEYRLLYGHKI